MAENCVQQAPRTLDLRQTVIAVRVNNKAMKLRWKLVAKTIFHLRKQTKNAPSGPARFHHHHVTNTQGPSSELAFLPYHLGEVAYRQDASIQNISIDSGANFMAAINNKARRIPITASSDNSARVWSIETGEIAKEYIGHQKALTSLSFQDGTPEYLSDVC